MYMYMYVTQDLPEIVSTFLCRSLLAKVKVTSHLVFPDELDLSSYTGKSTSLYHLSSFIVHCGASAYTGHYIAYIKNHKVGYSFTYNRTRKCMCVHL